MVSFLSIIVVLSLTIINDINAESTGDNYKPHIFNIPRIPEFPLIRTSGKTYHVNKDNGSFWSNGSKNKPWGTIQYGINQLSAGEVLIIHEAKEPYNENVNISAKGDANNWISIKGADGDNVVIRGGIGFSDQSKYITVKNITLQATGWTVLNLVNSSYLAFDDIEIDCKSNKINSNGLYIREGVTNSWFRDMDIHHCGYKKRAPTDGSGINIQVWETPNVIDKLTFINVTARNNKGDGISGRDGIDSLYFEGCKALNNTGDGFDLGSNLNENYKKDNYKKELVLKNCISANNGNDQGLGFKAWSKNIWLVNCLAYDNKWSAVEIKSLSNDSNVYILHNTFKGNNKGYFGGEIVFNGFSQYRKTNVYLYNNILHAINTKVVVFGDMHKQTLAGEDNNYYFSASLPNLIRKQNPAFIFMEKLRRINGGIKYDVNRSYTFSAMNNGTWFTKEGFGKNNIAETKPVDGKIYDPGYTNVSIDDYSLKEGSRAIDAGINVGVNYDILGNPRPQGKGVDIGAYEYVY